MSDTEKEYTEKLIEVLAGQAYDTYYDYFDLSPEAILKMGGGTLFDLCLGRIKESNKIVKEQNAAIISKLQTENERLRSKYQELIMAVAQKWPNESRHETVLRYIKERESALMDIANAEYKDVLQDTKDERD